MDVASSQLLSDTPCNPLISCSCFMLRLTARSRGETAGALPAGGGAGRGGGHGAGTAQQNLGCRRVARWRLGAWPRGLLGQCSQSYVPTGGGGGRFGALCHQPLVVTSSPENAHHATGERGWKQEEKCFPASSHGVAPSRRCLATALPGWEKRAADATALHRFLLPWQACPAPG